jgi:membrane-bound acyltransferase YfiQ involved in biofilm formation
LASSCLFFLFFILISLTPPPPLPTLTLTPTTSLPPAYSSCLLFSFTHNVLHSSNFNFLLFLIFLCSHLFYFLFSSPFHFTRVLSFSISFFIFLVSFFILISSSSSYPHLPLSVFLLFVSRLQFSSNF